MEKIELNYVSGNDFYVWERMEELFSAANFDVLEELIELEPIKIKSVKTSRECRQNTKEVLCAINNDLVKFISEEELYLIYFSNEA